MKTSRVLAWFSLVLVASMAISGEPRPVISIRASYPDRQVREVIGLFDGAKAPHPAAALAAWKRASREPGRLGKPLEALIAAFNPRMAEEFRTLDGAEVDLWFEPGDGRIGWGASLPHDDGTFAALGSAFVLSGGRAEPPLGELPVDRLAGPGSTLMARGPGGLFLAGTIEGLQVARERGQRPGQGVEPDGFRIEIEPGALRGARSPAARRLAEALQPMSGPLVAQVGMVVRAIVATLGLAGPRPVAPAVVEPSWLDWVPADRASAGFALAVDSEAGAWEAAFAMADRVERADPARSNVAPLRLRLDLMARAAGVRTESDLFPHLEGISGWVGSGGQSFDAALLAFHLDDQAAADRLADRVKPLPARDGAPAPLTGGVRSLGRLDGRPLRLARLGRSVVVAWGEGTLEDSMAARGAPTRSAGPALRRTWVQGPPACAGGVWPSRMPGLVPGGSPLARALADAPPMTWEGAWAGPAKFAVRVRWDGLDASVRRFLDLIPFNPPPDR